MEKSLKEVHWIATQKVLCLHTAVTNNQCEVGFILGLELLQTFISRVRITLDFNGYYLALLFQNIIYLSTRIGPPIVYLVIAGIRLAHNMSTDS